MADVELLPSGERAVPNEVGLDEAACGEGDESAETPDFAELLGPHCVIKRVDKDKNVIGGAKPEEMQREMMARAQSQKRLGACAEHVKDMNRSEKLLWAVELKDRANEFYAKSSFEEAARLYNDCLVALDLDGTEAEIQEVQQRLQLPVCTNLAACMIEMGHYGRVGEICDIALSVDPDCCKALYRRGLAQYRVGNHVAARPDFEAALKRVTEQRAALAELDAEGSEEARGLMDLERRTVVYLGHIRRFSAQERDACKRIFEQQAPDLYADRRGAPAEPEEAGPIDDSDEALDRALAQARGDWSCCPCRRRQKAD